MRSSKRSVRSKSVSFQDSPKHKPVNIDTLGLRRSPRLVNQEMKKLDSTLNHAGFTHVIDALEEYINEKETHTFKEAMNSPFKT